MSLQKKSSLSWDLLILWFLIIPVAQSKSNSDPDTLTTDDLTVLPQLGLLNQELQIPIFYDKVYPLVFALDISPLIKKLMEPTNTDQIPQYRAHEQNFKNINRKLHPSPGQIRDAEIVFECDELGGVFPSFYTSDIALFSYLKKLRSCFSYKAQDTSSFLRNVSTSELYCIDLEDSWNEVPFGEMETLLENGLRDCRGQKVPLGFVSFDLFQSHFNKNLDRFNDSQLPLKKDDLEKYLFNPSLTSCTVTSSGEMFVLILIPISSSSIEISSSYKLQSFTSLPFLFKERLTNKSGKEYICHIEGFDKTENRNYLLHGSLMGYKSLCKPGQLCHKEKDAMEKYLDSGSLCVSSILRENTVDYLKYCLLRCEEVTRYHYAPNFQQIGPNGFLIIGGSGGGFYSSNSNGNGLTLEIQCQNQSQEDQSRDLKVPNLSDATFSIDLQLPCGCGIMYSRLDEWFGLDGTCDPHLEKVDWSYSVPIHWLPVSLLPQTLDRLQETYFKLDSPLGKVIVENAERTVAVGRFVPEMDIEEEDEFETGGVGGATGGDNNNLTDNLGGGVGDSEGNDPGIIRDSQAGLIVCVILFSICMGFTVGVGVYILIMHHKMQQKIASMKAMVEVRGIFEL